MKQVFSNQGNTAIEIIIAAGLVGLVALCIFSLSQDTLKTIQSNKMAATRDQLATQFRQTAGRINNLRLSLKKPENKDFYNCVCGQGTGCTSALALPLALYEPSTPDPRPIDTFYDYSGLPCDKEADNCTIQVKVTFTPQCAPALPSADPTPPFKCVGVPAEFFAVTITVQQSEFTLHRGILLKPIIGSTYTQVSNLAPAGSGFCP